MHSSRALVLILCACVAYATAAADNGVPTLGNSDFRFNQTSTGRFTIVMAGQTVAEFSSSWMQDDGNERLFLNVGRPHEATFMHEWWILKDEVFETSMRNGQYHCSYTAGKGYRDEIMGYASPRSLSYMGPAKLYSDGWNPDTYYQLYMGPAQDIVGTLNVVCVVEHDPSCDSTLFRGMYTVGVPGRFHYNVYQLTEANSTVPHPSVYDVPQVCLQAKRAFLAAGGGGAKHHERMYRSATEKVAGFVME